MQHPHNHFLNEILLLIRDIVALAAVMVLFLSGLALLGCMEWVLRQAADLPSWAALPCSAIELMWSLAISAGVLWATGRLLWNRALDVKTPLQGKDVIRAGLFQGSHDFIFPTWQVMKVLKLV